MIRCLNNNSLIAVLMLLLFSAAAAAAAVIHKAPPSLSIQRQLVWARQEMVCDAATLAQARAIIDPSIFSCFTGSIQWDPDFILNVDYLSIFSFSYSGTSYTPIHDSNNNCRSFDLCITTDNFEVLIDEYEYDCSNVYCGPNAIRDCATGESRTVPCTDGLVSSPEIPSRELVRCLKERQHDIAYYEDLGLGDDNAVVCSECAAVDDDEDGRTISYSCASPCVGCYEDGSSNSYCVTDVSFTSSFSVYGGSITYCETLGSAGKYCYTLLFGPLVGTVENPAYYRSPSCTAEWNGASCACSICGAYDRRPLAIVDCSNGNVTAAFDECSQTSTGAFAGLYSNGLNLGSCPSRTPNADDGDDPDDDDNSAGKGACAVLVYACVGAAFFLFS